MSIPMLSLDSEQHANGGQRRSLKTNTSSGRESKDACGRAGTALSEWSGTESSMLRLFVILIDLHISDFCVIGGWSATIEDQQHNLGPWKWI